MDGLINKNIFIQWVKPIIEKLFEKFVEEYEGSTMNIDEFRKKDCGGKGTEWVRVFIFDKFPEVDIKNGGFVVNPRGARKQSFSEKTPKSGSKKTTTALIGM